MLKNIHFGACRAVSKLFLNFKSLEISVTAKSTSKSKSKSSGTGVFL